MTTAPRKITEMTTDELLDVDAIISRKLDNHPTRQWLKEHKRIRAELKRRQQEPTEALAIAYKSLHDACR